jgi:hypothetical protein
MSINGFSAELIVPEIRPRELVVAATASLHDVCEEKDLIKLLPGASVVFDRYDHATRWTHDPGACVEQLMYQRTFVHPDSNSPKYLSANDVDNACNALDDMHRLAATNWLKSFGMPRLRILAERKLPIADLVARATETLTALSRPVDPCWAEMPKYIESLKEKLRSTVRPINIRLRPNDRSRAGVALWRSVMLHRHLERLNDDRDAWKAVGPWYGPAGESNTPAGDGFPLPTAPAGACIVFAGTLNESEQLVQKGVARFGVPGDRYTNETGETIYCRLACNDPFPGDNLGELSITLSVYPKAVEPPS